MNATIPCSSRVIPVILAVVVLPSCEKTSSSWLRCCWSPRWSRPCVSWAGAAASPVKRAIPWVGSFTLTFSLNVLEGLPAVLRDPLPAHDGALSARAPCPRLGRPALVHRLRLLVAFGRRLRRDPDRELFFLLVGWELFLVALLRADPQRRGRARARGSEGPDHRRGQRLPDDPGTDALFHPGRLPNHATNPWHWHRLASGIRLFRSDFPGSRGEGRHVSVPHLDPGRCRS